MGMFRKESEAAYHEARGREAAAGATCAHTTTRQVVVDGRTVTECTGCWTGGRPPQDAEASREQVAAWREETPSTVLTARAEVDPLRAALAQAAAITGVEVAETSAGHVIVLPTEDDEDILARRRVRELLDRAGVQWAPDGPGRLEILGPRAAD